MIDLLLGNYILDGIDIVKAKDLELSHIRNQKIGFVFQTYNLVSKTNALKNVELPMLYAGMERNKRRKRAQELLELVEMEDRAKHLPEELSRWTKAKSRYCKSYGKRPRNYFSR